MPGDKEADFTATKRKLRVSFPKTSMSREGGRGDEIGIGSHKPCSRMVPAMGTPPEKKRETVSPYSSASPESEPVQRLARGSLSIGESGAAWPQPPMVLRFPTAQRRKG